MNPGLDYKSNWLYVDRKKTKQLMEVDEEAVDSAQGSFISGVIW